MSDNLYIVREHSEEGQCFEHGIFTDPNIARHRVDGIELQSFTSADVTSYTREGAEFVRAVEGDPGFFEYSVEREA